MKSTPLSFVVVLAVSLTTAGISVRPGRLLAAAPPDAPAAGAQPIELAASAATLDGKGLKLGSDGAIGNWSRKSDSVAWQFTPATAGWYTVQVVYSAFQHAGGTYQVEAANQALDGKVVLTRNWKDYKPVDLGAVQLAAAPTTLTIRANTVNGVLMNVKSVRLIPAAAPATPPRAIGAAADGAKPGTPPGAPAVPAAAAKTVIEFGGEADQIQAGGGGRYLAVHLKGAEQILVVDVVGGKLLHPIPAPGDCCFTADRDKLFLVVNSQHALQRWDLKTQQREANIALAGEKPIKIAAAGDAGAGPLALWGGGQVEFYDAASLKPLTVIGDEGIASEHLQIAPSADGLTFAVFGGLPRTPVRLLRFYKLTPTTAICSQLPMKVGIEHNNAWVMPSADGSLLVSFNKDAALYDHASTRLDNKELVGGTLFPTDDPRFLISVHHPDKKSTEVATVLAANGLRALCPVADLEPLTTERMASLKARFGLRPRIALLPDDKLLYTIPTGNDRVVVRHLDVKEALDAAGGSYLLVLSRPPLDLQPGAGFAYTIETWSKAGGVKYKLQQSPPGMTISPTGVIAWTAPAAGGNVKVAVEVSDGGGEVFLHAFELSVATPPPAVATVPPPARTPPAIATVPPPRTPPPARTPPAAGQPAGPARVANAAAPRRPTTKPELPDNENTRMAKRLTTALYDNEQKNVQGDPTMSTVSIDFFLSGVTPTENGVQVELIRVDHRQNVNGGGGEVVDVHHQWLIDLQKNGTQWMCMKANSRLLMIGNDGNGGGIPEIDRGLGDVTRPVRAALRKMQQPATAPTAKVAAVEGKPEPGQPADPEMKALAARLARKVQLNQMTRDAELMADIKVTVAKVEKISTGMRIQLSISVEQTSPGEWRTTRHATNVRLTSAPGGKWTVADARTRIEGITSQAGPVSWQTGAWNDITDEIQGMLDVIASEPAGPPPGPGAPAGPKGTGTP